MNSITLNMTPSPLRVTKPRWYGYDLVRLTPIGLSLLIHSAFFIYFGAAIFDKGSMQTKYGPISVHLQSPPVDTAHTRLTVNKDELTSTPTESTKALAPAQQKTLAKPVTPHASVVSQTVTPPIAPATTPSVEESFETSPTSQPAAITTTPASSTTEQMWHIKQHYLATLIARIESHKHYPFAARQRRMEGQTTVRFILLASGEVRKISIRGGPKLLRIASKAALQRALPLPKPPDTMDYPLPIQFNMEYRLI
jgi:protein TonB